MTWANVECSGGGLVMNWQFQSNWSDINDAMKGAAMGSARFNGKDKTWSIPLTVAMAVAKAVRPHFKPLADAIENNEQVKEHYEDTLQRVELSSAVDTVVELPENSFFPYMREYQRVAPIMYMAGGRKRILIADEMGLGKSLQALGCVELAGHQRVLIVCPAVVKHNWVNEIDKWVGDADICSFIINGYEGVIAATRFNIISYNCLDKRLDQLYSIGYDCIIFDEVHRLKNPKTKQTKAGLKLAQGKDGIIALSGTPITNRPMEFFPTLNMMLPAVFPDYFMFAKKYCNARYNGYGWDYSGASNIEIGYNGVTPLNHVLRDFMLRRSMDDPRIAEEMPSLVETIIPFDLEEGKMTAYRNEFNSWNQEWLHQQNNFGSSDAGFALNMMGALRKIAGYLKIDQAIKWAKEYYETTGKPLVIFAHHKHVVESIANNLDNIAAQITGETNDDTREGIIEQFQAGLTPFLVCSTTAMREGVNLDAADTTLFVEREWVPAWEQQAAARVRRMTQTASTCHKVILSANNTIDTYFDQVVAEKADIVQRALDGKTGTRDEIGKALLKKLKNGGILG